MTTATSINIEKIAQRIAKKSISLTTTIRGSNENIYFFGDGIKNSMHLIIGVYGDYKAINNPLSNQESITTGHVVEFGGVI